MTSWDTRWKVTNEMARLASVPAGRLRFALAGVRWGTSWKLHGIPIIQRHRRATITLGDRLTLRSTVRSNPLGVNHPVILSARRPGATLLIGDDFGMSGGSIVAEDSITIGCRVCVGANTVITDSDFHAIAVHDRRLVRAGRTAPIVIDDDVFIGMSVLVLKGVTIGSGSVIGAGSVVTHDIPPGVIAAGNPAQVLRASIKPQGRTTDKGSRPPEQQPCGNRPQSQ